LLLLNFSTSKLNTKGTCCEGKGAPGGGRVVALAPAHVAGQAPCDGEGGATNGAQLHLATRLDPLVVGGARKRQDRRQRRAHQQPPSHAFGQQRQHLALRQLLPANHQQLANYYLNYMQHVSHSTHKKLYSNIKKRRAEC